MSMLKMAKTNLDIIDVFSNPNEMREDASSGDESRKAVAQFRQTIATAKSKLKKSNDFAYIRTRAIGSIEKWGPNGNGDGFPLNELQASYKTFIGKGNFIDHHSDDITKIRGLVVDAFMNNEDQSVECLIAVDRKSHPQLARDIETGVVNSVSMGTRVGYSNCSVCSHSAKTENEYCDHIRSYKGMKVGWLTNNEAHKYGSWPIHEINHDLEFIELSWVSVPAFKEANVLERLASLKKAVTENNDKFGSAIDEGLQIQESSILNRELNNFVQSDTEKEIIELARMSLRSHIYNDDRKTNASRYGIVHADTSGVSELRASLASAECRDTECDFDPRKSNKINKKEITAMQRIKIDIKELTLRKASKDFAAKGSISIENKSYDWKAVSGDKKDWQISFDSDVLDAFSSQGISQIINAIKELLSKNIDSTELVVASVKLNTKTGYLQNQNEDPNMSEYINDRYKDGKDTDKPIYPNKNLEVPGVGDVTQSEFKAYSESAKEGPAGALGKSKDITENSSKGEIEYKTELQRAYMRYKFIKKAAEEVSEDESDSDKKKYKYNYVGSNNKLMDLDDNFGISVDEIISLYSDEDSESGGSKQELNKAGGQIIDLLDKIYDTKEVLNQTQKYRYPDGGDKSKAEKERSQVGESLVSEKDSLIDKLDEVKNAAAMKKILNALQRYSSYLDAFSQTEGDATPKNVPNFTGEVGEENEIAGEEVEEVSDGDFNREEFMTSLQSASDIEGAAEILQDKITSGQFDLLSQQDQKDIKKIFDVLNKKKQTQELEGARSRVSPETRTQLEQTMKQRDELRKQLREEEKSMGGLGESHMDSPSFVSKRKKVRDDSDVTRGIDRDMPSLDQAEVHEDAIPVKLN